MAVVTRSDNLQRVVNHVFLPPCLPQQADDDSEVLLVNITLNALTTLSGLLPSGSPNEAIDKAITLLKNLEAINCLPGGQIDESELQRALTSLPAGRTLAAKVSCQNAAIVITRFQDELVFEEFELSGCDNAVTTTVGRLVRTFPGLAVAVPATLLDQCDFPAMISSTLSTMCHKPAPDMQPKTRKAGIDNDENRDTTNPAMVSELFMGVLRGIGMPTKVLTISKNTRDEVLWKNVKAPWRRSPMWLLIRVCLQLVILRSPGGSITLYKEVMVFIMSQILQSSLQLPAELVYTISAKIHRRLRKLSAAETTASVLPNVVTASIDHVLQQSSDCLAKRWDLTQKDDSRDLQLNTLATLNFEHDTFVALPALEAYIKATRTRQKVIGSTRFTPCTKQTKYNTGTLPSLPSDMAQDPYFATANLNEFEQWVSQRIDHWVATNTQDDGCEKLQGLMRQYHSLATRHYTSNPEATSLMILTIFELWVACDKEAIRVCSWLSDYDPGIPPAVLQNLLLPLLNQMERLSQLEAYLDKRRAESTKKPDRLFTLGSHGFANQYFDISDVHQALLLEIKTNAEAARSAKASELQKMLEEYRRLDALFDGTVHEYTTRVIDDWCDPPETTVEHDSGCKKCYYASQRDALRIQVHEWPLPSDPSEAKAVVFELRVPSWLRFWREARFYLLQEVLKGERARVYPVASYVLSSNDPHLWQHHSQRLTRPRIDLLSQSKPFSVSHYSQKKVTTALRETEILVPNGLQYKYYDTTSDAYTGEFMFKDVIPLACTYALPCQALQRFVFRPASAPDGPDPNTVIASQDASPENMTLEEYKDLSSIALGRHIQWANILLQLAMPSLDFKKPETTLVLLQCVYQTGPPGSSVLRDSHDFFHGDEGPVSLLQQLAGALQRVKENWESSQALHAFVAIAARALSLSASFAVQEACLAFLATARDIAMGWVVNLREKAHAAEDHADRTIFVLKSVEIALICTSTYDVDDHYLGKIFAGENNASVFVQSSIAVQEGEHSQPSDREQHVALLGMRHKRLLHRVHRHTLLVEHHHELDDAIRKSWTAYVPSSGWRVVSEAADDWLTTDTLATPEAASMSVHYHMLSGELLVNGLPLDQPPRSYREQDLYSKLFGRATVEVMPSTTSGFQFTTKREFGGSAVQLGLSTSGDLIVRATTGGSTYETIPSRLVGMGYPDSFGKDYVHWYNATKNTVQLRSVCDPWNASSTAAWTLSRWQTKWRLTKAACHVASIVSPTTRRISRVLEALACRSRIHSIVQPSGELHVHIPTLRLGFTLERKSQLLKSKEFRSMAVDVDQSLGSLIGLRSKIMLKHVTMDDRLVLVPESQNVTYSQKDGHIAVDISRDSVHRVHAIHVDPRLGRLLLDNTDLGCNLYMAYLHALTSSCLVDPLTHKTGTEQALTILKSAAVRSFDHLSQDHISILDKIAGLSPGRCYYPTHLRNMQTVHWDPKVSFMSQHGHFFTAVKSLVLQAKQATVFFPDTQLSFPKLGHIDEHLLRRDNVRSATFRVSGFGAEDHTVLSDLKYEPRDQNLLSERAIRASAMSRLIFRDGFDRSEPNLATGYVWRKMCTFDIIYGPELSIQVSEVRYDPSLLEEGGPALVVQRLPALHRWLGKPLTSQKHKFSVMMWLSTMASASISDAAMLQAVAMFFKSAAMAQCSIDAPLPQTGPFHPKEGKICFESVLRGLLYPTIRTFESSPEYKLSRHMNERSDDWYTRRYMRWCHERDSAISTLVNGLIEQWPCEVPKTPDVASTYIEIDAAMLLVTPKFKGWHDNKLLDQYLASLEHTMSSIPVRGIGSFDRILTKPSAWPSASGYVSEDSIFHLPAPALPQSSHHTGINGLDFLTQGDKHGKAPILGSVVKTLKAQAGRSKHEHHYIADLTKSLDALASQGGGLSPSVNLSPDALSSYLRSCSRHVDTMYHVLMAAVSPVPNSSRDQARYYWPRLSPTFFLGQLSRNRWRHLPGRWKACIVNYALALTVLQRAERLMKLTKEEELIAELRNPGHQNWDPMEYPESLLMEVESGILIRNVQEQVAAQMRNPPNGQNAVMQLNMGEGKSSVIVPMVAAALADRRQLLRVVVAKPQSKQMAQMLISKLGGLVARRVYHMPISRSLRLDQAAACTISGMLRECMSEGGILLLQPEHILSFQLMAPECYIIGKQDVGRELVSTQDFLDQYSRDLVDESDENFSVKFELIYTMGEQRPIDFSPTRWLLVQEVLDLVRLLAPAISQEFPLSLEYHPSHSGSFPRLRILRPDAEAVLLQQLAVHICDNGLSGFQISRQPEEIRKAVHSYITKYDLCAEEINAVEGSLFWTETTRSPLLLLRGIIAGGVLKFVLGQKRWRVNYGLASRTPPTRLAVPYRAKDSPSPRSEFSHPDIVIALTSLSYYYGGLSNDDLFTAMGFLMDSDQSDIEYQLWVRDAHGLPSSFKQLQGINLKDRPSCINQLFPALRLSKNAIDYFLSHIVFPKEMKEFPLKLSASGWDIGKRKELPVTGFSGTNDSRCLLPIDVDHLDHPDQKHTNALVLEYILQPENGVVLMEPAKQKVSDAEHLLATVMSLTPPVQVLLDVGAQILELNNLEVAKTWLSKHETTKEAAVFVNDEDELCVVDRNGRVDVLRTSSFYARLDSCLIFLDDAHTRGIDLKLPSSYRAAVTLGAGLTKDRLVQACMRMRKLGHGQTVVFCVSQEIQVKIHERTATAQSSEITVADVIVWSISETHTEIRRSMPLWAVQGERFVRQESLKRQVCHNGVTNLSKNHAEKFQEDEAQTLDDRFRPRQVQAQPVHLANTSDPDLQRIAERCQRFDDLQFNSSTLQEEQERELSPEIEQERQVQKAPPAQPALHSLHKDVEAFAATGAYSSTSKAYMLAFDALKDSSAANGFAVLQLAGDKNLLATADFVKTVKRPGGASYVSDAFQRPVQWLLTSRTEAPGGSGAVNRIMIISPYEANQLYKRMKKSTAASLHVYKPRSNSGYSTLDQLDFHTISAQVAPPTVPRDLAIQLDLFAGQLYISSYVDYQEICKFLGLSTEALTKEMSEAGWKVAADGYILSDGQGRRGGGSGVLESPVSFFKILISKIRRNGDGIAKTDMGKLLEGSLFHASDFEE